jgi:hypothetical protein
MAPKRIIYYTPEGDAFKSRYISIIENSGVPGVDRSIDIIYQTPDDVIIPYLAEALSKNPKADPKKLVQAVKGAEHKIFKDFQAAPWDEVHHGRASLSSMRNVRYLPPEERVLALNTTADALGGPIGNSRFNLRGNSASRPAHTGGLFPWKNAKGEKYRDLYNLPTIPTSSSMHPMGTNAANDPRGIVVPQVSTASEFTNKAVESSKVQFGDTITGRQSDISRRIIIDNMLEKTPPSLAIGSPLIYGVNAEPADVRASKLYFQLPENEKLRTNIAKASFTLDSPQGQRLMQNEANRAKAALYIADSYLAGLPMPSREFIKENAKGIGAGAAMGAITPEAAYAAGKGDLGTAAVEGAKGAFTGGVVGGAIEAGLTTLMPRAAAALTGGPAAPLIAGVGTALALQDAAQAYRAGQSGRSIPLQKKVEQAQSDVRRKQDVAQFRAAMPGPASRNRMQANLSGNLSPQQIESFRAGGGNAAMMRDNLSVQQVIERGSSLRYRQIINNITRKEGNV